MLIWLITTRHEYLVRSCYCSVNLWRSDHRMAGKSFGFLITEWIFVTYKPNDCMDIVSFNHWYLLVLQYLILKCYLLHTNFEMFPQIKRQDIALLKRARFLETLNIFRIILFTLALCLYWSWFQLRSQNDMDHCQYQCRCDVNSGGHRSHLSMCI